MDGALMEVGPYRLKDDHTLEYNPGRWDEFANLLFVDNPVGTGFSYASSNGYIHELDEMADQFIVFMEKFFEMFPEFESDDVRTPFASLWNCADLSSSTLRVSRMLASISLISRRPSRSVTRPLKNPEKVTNGPSRACLLAMDGSRRKTSTPRI